MAVNLIQLILLNILVTNLFLRIFILLNFLTIILSSHKNGLRFGLQDLQGPDGLQFGLQGLLGSDG